MSGRIIRGLLLVTMVASGVSSGRGGPPKLHEPGKGKWEDIAVPSAPVLSTVDNLPERARVALPETYFRRLRLKPGVQLFTSAGGRQLWARLGEKASRITPESIGYFIEEIDSEFKAAELAMFFHHGVFLRDKEDFVALIQACRDSKVARVAETIPSSSGQLVDFDQDRSAYRVSFGMYRRRNVFQAQYLVTRDGLIGRKLRYYVIGPARIVGLPIDPNNEVYVQYKKTSEAFEGPIAKPLENAAIKVLEDDRLNWKGLGKARENALAWLLSRGDIKQNAGAILKFLGRGRQSIDPRLSRRALSKLDIALADLLKEQAGSGGDLGPAEKVEVNKDRVEGTPYTYWAWPSFLVGAVAGMGCLCLLWVARRKVSSRIR
jgi:hypothetical protein